MDISKKVIIDNLVDQVNTSPFLIVMEYGSLDVPGFGELRTRLSEVNAEMHVVKNRLLKRALESTESPDLNDSLVGQSAIVTGEADICPVAKILKNFADEFDKPKFKIGLLNNNFIDEQAFKTLATLPPLATLQAKLLGVLMAPASKLVRTLNEPASSLARVLTAKLAQN